MGDDLFFRNVSRRDFLKKAGQTAVALGGLELIACRTTQGPKTDVSRQGQTVVYPPLKGHKIQPPENGCLVGLRKVYTPQDRSVWRTVYTLISEAKSIEEMASLNKNPVYQESLKGIDFGGGIHTYIEYYETHLGRKPASAVLISMPTLYNYFPTVEATILAQQGITPYVYLESFPFLKPSVRMDLTDIVKGRYNNLIGEVAQESKKFGETFGGFFVSTLHEMNGFWYYWGQSSKFKNSWRRIVDIWEDKGTNQYATWVWHIACPEAHTSPRENTLGTSIHKVHCT